MNHVHLFNRFRYVLYNAGCTSIVHNVSYLVLLQYFRVILAGTRVLTSYVLIVSHLVQPAPLVA
jgi:hypothetical protein